MKYENIKKALFLSRPNRFIANIEIDGREEICHVKNTGRCKELLLPRANIYVQEQQSKRRKTKYDLISVYKQERLINIDSQAPNKLFHEWVLESNFFKDVQLIKPEARYKNSRFDFYLETSDRKILVEVKGVTLEENGVAMFPDAPTERGVRHLHELGLSIKEGFEAYVFFVIQMKGVRYFTPNVKTHPAFGETLVQAANLGVQVLAFDCEVTSNTITPRDMVDCKLQLL
ncbi:MAG: DNA/RNA nuclease SfsA [Pelotomaculum sp.]|jgi:sugar fermentation stimulation protein A